MIPSSSDTTAQGAEEPVVRWTPGVLKNEPEPDETRPTTPPPARAPDAAEAIETAHQRGYQEGLEDGLSEGRRAERSELSTARTTLEAVAADLAERREEWLETFEENVSALAVTVARQIIGHELEANRDVVAHLVRRALAGFPTGQTLVIRLNPEDLALLTEATASEGGEAPVAPGRDVRWIADPRIQPGGCVVEGPERVVDGRIDRALERLYRSLTDG